jgi:ribonuclease Z
MRLQFLGTSGYHPTERRQTSCLLLPEFGIVLDAGKGAFRLGKYLKTDEADIFLTHSHLDHIAGLTYLFSVMIEHPLRRLSLRAEGEILQAVKEHLFAQSIFPVEPPFDFLPLENSKAGRVVDLPRGGRLTYFPVPHTGRTVGYRLDWPGHSMAYVTDTTASSEAAYVENLRGVDLLVHECYFSDARADLSIKFGHSRLSAVAEVARHAEAGRLMLTHINPLSTSGECLDLEAARTIFPRIDLAEDLAEAEF